MTEPLRRGEGPWPRTNTEPAVSAWLHGRMGQVEDSERQAIVRWMLDLSLIHISEPTRPY